MGPLWSETCWSTFKYFIILIVSAYYILRIGWITKCLTLTPFAWAVTGSLNPIPGKPENYLSGSMLGDREKERDCRQSGKQLRGNHSRRNRTDAQTVSCYVYMPVFVLQWRCGPSLATASSFFRFLDHTQRRTTVGRTPLDEWSARRRNLYLTTHNTHKDSHP